MRDSSGKQPRTMRPNELRAAQKSLERNAELLEAREVKETEESMKDPIQFCRQVLGYEPTEYEKKFMHLFVQNQFSAGRWCRQSGKSFTVSICLLYYARKYRNSHIGIVAPSLRQGKINIRKITYFLKRLPPSWYFKPLRTILRFTNGSVIEAFPNNPDTIRGPTLDIVHWDEANFFSNDEEIYDAILFTLGTTNGKLVVTSTPWNTDSLFYKIFHNKYYSDFAKSHVSWQQAQEPHGPLKKKILDKIRRQLTEDPWRWKREMEAEWAEDENVWLPQSLITKCIASQKTLGYEIELFPWDSYQQGDFFAGLDLGKHQDYSALVIIEKVVNKFLLRHLKIWPLETSYASVIGYTKALQDRWGGFIKIRVDMTGVGDYIVEDMQNADIDNVEGVTFTLPRKQEMASLLKQRMINNQCWYPYFTWNKPYQGEYVTELNVERFELRKDGHIAFSHPRGTHDDVFWATALSLYATVEMKPEPEVWVVPR
jgi:hypothetical protein